MDRVTMTFLSWTHTSAGVGLDAREPVGNTMRLINLLQINIYASMRFFFSLFHKILQFERILTFCFTLSLISIMVVILRLNKNGEKSEFMSRVNKAIVFCIEHMPCSSTVLKHFTVKGFGTRHAQIYDFVMWIILSWGQPIPSRLSISSYLSLNCLKENINVPICERNLHFERKCLLERAPVPGRATTRDDIVFSPEWLYLHSNSTFVHHFSPSSIPSSLT